MKILHIIRERNDPLALRAIMEPVSEEIVEVGVLLLHDSVLSTLPDGIKVYACRDDVEARGIKVLYSTLDYGEIIKLIFDYESVITW